VHTLVANMLLAWLAALAAAAALLLLAVSMRWVLPPSRPADCAAVESPSIAASRVHAVLRVCVLR
jgi:hypothetical protein